MEHHALPKALSQLAPGGISDLEVIGMQAGERSRLPPLHPRRDHGNGILTPPAAKGITADLLEAGLAEKLDGAGDIPRFAQVPGQEPPVDRLVKCAARNAQLWVLAELAQQSLEVARLKGDVGIQVADEVVRQALEHSMAMTQGLNLTGEIDTPASVIPSGKNDEVRLALVILDDAIGIVRRAVADDDPPAWPSALRHDRLEGVLDVHRLISSSGEEHIR